jgi:hypothetical protein
MDQSRPLLASPDQNVGHLLLGYFAKYRFEPSLKISDTDDLLHGNKLLRISLS